jgi:lysophospholipase L1-like esterase
VVDVASGLPQANESLWDDGLHLSAKGYERLGELVHTGAREVFERVERARAQQ